MNKSPSTNGRGTNGQFAPGNSGGPGNPFAKQVAVLRSALMAAVKPEDLTEVVNKLVELAKGGDIQAAKLILDRTLGKTVTVDIPAAATEPDEPTVGRITPENLEERRQQLRELAMSYGHVPAN